MIEVPVHTAVAEAEILTVGTTDGKITIDNTFEVSGVSYTHLSLLHYFRITLRDCLEERWSKRVKTNDEL